MSLPKWGNPWRLRGHVDTADRYHVSGWAVRAGSSPLLTISVNGIVLDRIVPAGDRPDLKPLCGANTRHGFNHVFDDPLEEGAILTVTDRFGRHLANSPAVIRAEPALSAADLMGLSTPIPPPDLMFLVVGHRDRRQFAHSRRPPVDYILQRLAKAGIDTTDFHAILDFGCGCGRILAGWEGRLPEKAVLLGCDIHPKLVAFCQKNIPFATTCLSNYLPPLEFIPDAQLDLVYAASVFTHLTPEAVALWAEEMARIIKPDGALMLSFHGAHFDETLAHISENGPHVLRQDGIYTHLHDAPDGTHLGSNYYATFMTPDFVAAAFRKFELINMTSGERNPFMSTHDIALFRRLPGA